MPLPDDFGFGVVATLSRVCVAHRARLHKPFWSAWEEAVLAAPARLSAWRGDADPLDGTATHEFESVSSVRIGGVLVEPATRPISAGVVVLHGYGNPEPVGDAAKRWRRMAERGVAVLVIRVRGYPASSRDCGDWRAGAHGSMGWITRGLDADVRTVDGLMLWSLPLAVADIACAARALRGRIGSGLPVSLFGESFGGGLATIAAARMAAMGAGPARLCIGLPSLGDWELRAKLRSGGMGHEVREYLLHHADREDELRDALALGDSAVHARGVRCPTLCKLAERDDVVPAPTAAAVFNGIDAEPSTKWRFVVPVGHTDGGLGDARRHALFRRCAEDFLDPAVRPGESMARWSGLMEAGERTLAGGDPLKDDDDGEEQEDNGPGLFGAGVLVSLDDSDRALIEAYRSAGRTLDDLPYTAEFDALVRSMDEAAGAGMKTRDVLHRLHTLRKAGKLPRMGRSGSAGAQTSLDADEVVMLEEMVVDAVGSLGQRDRLPYTDAFERLCERLEARTGVARTAHDVWRLVARLAK